MQVHVEPFSAQLPDNLLCLVRLPVITQRGDSGSALPLYERALAIYEAAYGPEHPDVAHTLTDLAVLHLEQVGVGSRG